MVLVRNPGETLNIGDDIKIVVLSVKGNQVRIGIKAPLSVPVHRKEIYDRIKAERIAKDKI